MPVIHVSIARFRTPSGTAPINESRTRIEGFDSPVPDSFRDPFKEVFGYEEPDVSIARFRTPSGTEEETPDPIAAARFR